MLLITIDAKGMKLSPALVEECVLRCQREGRACTEIWVSRHELERVGGANTLASIPLMAHPEHDPDSLLFADARGTILELYNLALPLLPELFVVTVRGETCA